MVDALTTSVNVTMVGTVNYAIQSFVIRDVMITVSARTELACASPDGTGSIARSKVVPEGKIR